MTGTGDERRADGADDVAGGSDRGVVASATTRLYRFLKGHRALDAVVVWVSRRVREAPPSSRLNVVLGPLRARFRGEMTAAAMFAVVEALESEGLRFWIAGGWGVDLLAGTQTRRHDDLDVVLADYEGDESRARDALAPLGYRLVEVLDGLWMTPRSLIDDGAGLQIEILGIDRTRLDSALGCTDGEPGSSTPVEDRSPELFTTGTLGGRRAPCLSIELQLLFHSGFDPRGVDGPDVQLLRSMTSAR